VGTQEGPRFVQVTEETLYARLEEGKEVEIGAEELHQGLGIAIFGHLDHEGRTLTAERVVVLPPKP
jgi:hypothetical protein